MTKLDDIDEAFARLTLLEFAVEVVMANWVANMPQQYSDTFKADFVRVSTKTYGAITGDEQTARHMHAISARVGEIAERLIDKVSRREVEVRARKPQGQ